MKIDHSRNWSIDVVKSGSRAAKKAAPQQRSEDRVPEDSVESVKSGRLSTSHNLKKTGIKQKETDLKALNACPQLLLPGTVQKALDASVSAYRKVLEQRSKTLKKRIETADISASHKKWCLHALPNLDKVSEISPAVLREGQKVTILDIRKSKQVQAEFQEILPFSDGKEYRLLQEHLQKHWVKDLKEDHQNADILYRYRVPDKLDSDSGSRGSYFMLWAGGKIQGVVNLVVQKDNRITVRALNTAPWNQGDNPQYKGAGTALMAKAVSLCFETDNFPLRLTVEEKKRDSARYYKSLGMQFRGKVVSFKGKRGEKAYLRFEFDKPSALKFLEKFHLYSRA